MEFIQSIINFFTIPDKKNVSKNDADNSTITLNTSNDNSILIPDGNNGKSKYSSNEVGKFNGNNRFCRSDDAIDLNWKSISVSTVTKNRKQGSHFKKEIKKTMILENVSGYAKSCTFTAILGPSAAGKTTLINFLSGRLHSKSFTASGQYFINQQEINDFSQYKGHSAYVMEDDVLMATLTPRESFTFVARLRMKESAQERNERVEALIEELGLSKAADTYIGNDFIRGISGGERKRTAIGIELITNPSLIFLDEPTTGVDSTTAFNIVQTLKNIASKGKTIIASLYQPSSQMFNSLDNLILMSKGFIVYQGPAQNAASYFESLGFRKGEFENPSNFFMKMLTPGGFEIHSKNFFEENEESIEKYEVGFREKMQDLSEKFNVSEFKENFLSRRLNIKANEITKASLFSQTMILISRNALNIWRNPLESRVRIIQTLVFAAFSIMVFYYVNGFHSVGERTHWHSKSNRNSFLLQHILCDDWISECFEHL